MTTSIQSCKSIIEKPLITRYKFTYIPILTTLPLHHSVPFCNICDTYISLRQCRQHIRHEQSRSRSRLPETDFNRITNQMSRPCGPIVLYFWILNQHIWTRVSFSQRRLPSGKWIKFWSSYIVGDRSKLIHLISIIIICSYKHFWDLPAGLPSWHLKREHTPLYGAAMAIPDQPCKPHDGKTINCQTHHTTSTELWHRSTIRWLTNKNEQLP